MANRPGPGNENKITAEPFERNIYRIRWTAGGKTYYEFLNPGTLNGMVRRGIPGYLVPHVGPNLNAYLAGLPAGTVVIRNPWTGVNVRRGNINRIVNPHFGQAVPMNVNRQPSPPRRSRLNRARSAARRAGRALANAGTRAAPRVAAAARAGSAALSAAGRAGRRAAPHVAAAARRAARVGRNTSYRAAQLGVAALARAIERAATALERERERRALARLPSPRRARPRN